MSTAFIPSVRCQPLDPSQTSEFSHSIREKGVSCKTIFDGTVPYRLKKKFKRAPFADVDLDRFLKNSFDPAV